jgi:hypothetical protein
MLIGGCEFKQPIVGNVPSPHKKSKADTMVNSDFVNPKEKL